MNTLFAPTVYRISLAGVKDSKPERQAELYAQKILAAREMAGRHLGGQPTHVIADRNLLINLETLEGAGLKVVRRARERALKLQVDLAREIVRETRASLVSTLTPDPSP
jgi:hypothetical protein